MVKKTHSHGQRHIVQHSSLNINQEEKGKRRKGKKRTTNTRKWTNNDLGNVKYFPTFFTVFNVSHYIAEQGDSYTLYTVYSRLERRLVTWLIQRASQILKVEIFFFLFLLNPYDWLSLFSFFLLLVTTSWPFYCLLHSTFASLTKVTKKGVLVAYKTSI